MSLSTTYEAELMEHVRVLVHHRLLAAVDAGMTARELGDPAAVADAMAAALPAHPLDHVAGPFYDTAGLTTWLGTSRQALHQRVRSGSLLACHTADGHTVYPSYQFTPTGATIPGLSDVLAEFRRAEVDEWTVAVWLATPADDLAGSSAAEWLAKGKDPAVVVEAAVRDAAVWAV